MIESAQLEHKAVLYREKCKETNKNPTFAGFGRSLNISKSTVSRVVHGYYKHGKAYGKREHCTRCIANNDFETVQALFETH